MLNQRSDLIACNNCVIELRNYPGNEVIPGELPRVYIRKGRPDDYISFVAGKDGDLEPINMEYDARTGRLTPFDPNTPEQIILNDFFTKVFPNENLRRYVLTLLAACLEGNNREQKFYIMTGGGGNGKSKLVELMRYSLGDYLSSLSTTAITRKRPDSGAANPDIIKIKNKRAIIMQEPDPNEPLNTSRMKQFSGEDDVEARGLFQDQETFKITGKLFMSCNKLPPVNTMDNGTWRRIRVIPFEARFVDKEDTAYDPSKNVYYKDFALDGKLKAWRESFFSLLVHYYETRYLKNGLNPPPVVMQVSNQYKYNHDSFAKFYESCIRRNPDEEDVTLTKVYKTYTSWWGNLAGSSGAKLKAEEFKTRLEEKLNTTITRHVRGIKLFASEEDAEDHDKHSTD